MSQDPKKKIGIIGAGPAGMAAAITAGRILTAAEGYSMWQIDLLEKNEEPGKKLLATGNGKCNITNKFAEDFQIVQGFFNDLGIPFTEEERGRLYPYSKQAKTVRDTLVNAANTYGVNIITGMGIENICKPDNFFILRNASGKEHKYEKLIIATGGKAGIQYGSTGDGYKFARALGIEVSSILPALVPMTYCDAQEYDLKKLKGVRADAELTLIVNGEDIASEAGEIQFTDYGISGICTFDLSRYLKNLNRTSEDCTDCFVSINLTADLSEEDIYSLLESGPIAGLKGIVNEKIEALLLEKNLDPMEEVKYIIKLLKNFTVNISGTKGWKQAQVTAGGVSLSGVDLTSMESKAVDNLYFAGEVLDYDGPCGGYNLNWAWRTGIQAGLGVTNGIEADDQT